MMLPFTASRWRKLIVWAVVLPKGGVVTACCDQCSKRMPFDPALWPWRGGGSSATMQAVDPRRACGLYVWDVPSAVLSIWCRHLLKDCVYEGRGGRKFVRIRPGSILQLLYPCSRYSQDRCVICGGTFRDHLDLWWSKHLFVPYDRALDRTSKLGIIVTEDRNDIADASPPVHAFHRRYVVDLDEVYGDARDDRQRKNRLARACDKHAQLRGRPVVPKRGKLSGKTYLVPATSLESPDGERVSFVQQFMRGMALGLVDELMALEEADNRRARRSLWSR